MGAMKKRMMVGVGVEVGVGVGVGVEMGVGVGVGVEMGVGVGVGVGVVIFRASEKYAKDSCIKNITIIKIIMKIIFIISITKTRIIMKCSQKRIIIIINRN